MKNKYIVILVIILILSIISIYYITHKYENKIAQLDIELKQLMIEKSNLEKITREINIEKKDNERIKSGMKVEIAPVSYQTYNQKKRYIEKNSNMYIYPDQFNNIITKIASNTVVTVLDAGIYETSKRELWLYIEIPIFDAPMSNKGWILESETVPYTKNNQNLVLAPVYIKKGKLIYYFDSIDQITQKNATIVSKELIGKVDKVEGSYAHIESAGGDAFWVKKTDISYPEID